MKTISSTLIYLLAQTPKTKSTRLYLQRKLIDYV